MTNWTKRATEDAQDLINNFEEVIKEALKNGDEVSDD